MEVGATEAFCSTGARQHAETLHGIVPGRILSAIEVVSASRSMAYITGRGRVFGSLFLFMCLVTMRVAKIVVEIEAFFLYPRGAVLMS